MSICPCTADLSPPAASSRDTAMLPHARKRLSFLCPKAIVHPAELKRAQSRRLLFLTQFCCRTPTQTRGPDPSDNHAVAGQTQNSSCSVW